ncbi:hypothetical protein TrRE_jg10244, partial [Triparma retinervis]
MVKRRAVEVIECPSDDVRTNFKRKSTTSPDLFPSSYNPLPTSLDPNTNNPTPSLLTSSEEAKYKKMGKSIKSSEQFSEMFKEVQKAGSQQFTGYARKLYKEETYEKTVGK